MGKLSVKNKRLKMSPNGLITLPVSARRALGIERGENGRYRISSDGKSITLTSKPKTGETFYKVSSKGMVTLKGQPKELLLNSKGRHYWIKVDDSKKEVKLMPF